MTELKTLKDLQTYIEEREMDFVSIKLLKYEAVKHYKRFSMKSETGLEMSNTARWIKTFFNLTEEDLK